MSPHQVVENIRGQELFAQVSWIIAVLFHSIKNISVDVMPAAETITESPSCPHEVELRGGSLNNEGNVFLYGKPICDDQWDENDAVVACRMLGYISLIIYTFFHLFSSDILGVCQQQDQSLALFSLNSSLMM